MVESIGFQDMMFLRMNTMIYFLGMRQVVLDLLALSHFKTYSRHFDLPVFASWQQVWETSAATLKWRRLVKQSIFLGNALKSVLFASE